MTNFNNIIKNIDFNQNEEFCIAQIVEIEGSNYIQLGAIKLISNKGFSYGFLSGGCLESNIIKIANNVIDSKIPVIKKFDKQNNSVSNTFQNFGCNGEITVLFSYFNKEFLNFIKNSIENRFSFLEISVYDSNINDFVGKKIYVNSDKAYISDINDSLLINAVLKKIDSLKIHYNQSIDFVIDNIKLKILLNFINPNRRLFIFGSGYDSKPLIKLAKFLNWEVYITSDSYSITFKEEFIDADFAEYIDRDDILKQLHFDEFSYCVIMSHNYDYDLEVLKSLLLTNVKYIGILGPKKRFEQMKNHIENFETNSYRIFSPIGLDIGSQSTEEIALSILSEILSIINFKSNNHLKYINGKIH